MAAPTFDVFSNFQNIINGQLSDTAEKRHGINPATGEPNPEVPVSTREDVDNAVNAAQEAFITWSDTPFPERQKVVLAFADEYEKHADEFIKLLVQEQGKPLFLATMEVHGSVNYLRETTTLAESLKDQVLQEDDSKRTLLRYTPIGVGVSIIPWNFPISIFCQKLAPAVLTGNTVILKPSPYTPYTALKLGELAQGFFPKGVVQVLSGDEGLGPLLTAHPGVDKISFTGSSATGRKVMEAASKGLKRVTLELGGKDAAIICKDIDIEAVAAKVATFAFINSGQICTAIKRVYVHEAIYEQFLSAAAAFTKNIAIGPGDQEGVFMGPVQNSMQFDKVKTFFAEVGEGDLARTNGGICSDKPGFFIKPTIIDRPDEKSRIATEEPFGPIVPFMSWSEEKDVIGRANSTRMGLGASVWSNDLEEATRIAGKLQAGSVWVNSHLDLDPKVPFGGHKDSGIGTESGVEGLKGWCNVQSLFLKK
ncbi:aldehyde dehydrogenase domain-containing protein [Aspergillus karnatakaensis]|uniref:aldehyde dehydrogenase family protein n=1 Tax=Aspergillus karnatakaensis TaxID=1810916 RepID=UPI003CCCEFD9